MKFENMRVIQSNSAKTIAIYGDHGTRLASVNRWYGTADRRLALAELFAAAPRMRDALQAISDDGCDDPIFCLRIAREILAGFPQ